MSDEQTEQLRRRLNEQARHAPAGEFLAERVIARAEAAPAAGDRRFGPRWGRLLAVVAAIAVVVGIGAVAFVVTDTGSERSDDRAAKSTAPPSTSGPGSSSAPSVAPTPTRSPESSTGPRRISVGSLSNVAVADITFTGGGNGWSLATADCLKGTGTCSALLHTADNGKSWQSRPGTPFTVAARGARCSSRCVSHIRFATDDTGYAFSRTALFMTTDGAKHWQRLDGGADALETLGGNVIRVTGAAGSRYTAQVADVGSSDWRSVNLPGRSAAAGVSLSRTGNDAYVLATGSPSVLWSSDDDGLSWTNRGEPCPQGLGDSDLEVDATALTTASNGAVVVACRPRVGGVQSIAASTDGGKKFARNPDSLGAAEITTLGAASSEVVLVSSDDTYRTNDGGARFTRANGLGPVSYLGFSSADDAHAIAADGRTIYTTSNAGRSWQAGAFR